MNVHPNKPITERIISWSEWHALTMLVAVLSIFFFLPLGVFALLILISFGTLIVYCRPFWTPKQTFGPANSVTTLRLAGLIILVLTPDLKPNSVIGISIIIFLMDGLDGFIARKMNLESEFGEYFDKEVDALFMLILCILLHRGEQFGSWILIPGSMRYFFVLYLKLATPPQQKETRNSFSKWIFFLMIASLIFDFSAFASASLYLTLIATILLGYSFLLSILRFYKT